MTPERLSELTKQVAALTDVPTRNAGLELIEEIEDLRAENERLAPPASSSIWTIYVEFSEVDADPQELYDAVVDAVDTSTAWHPEFSAAISMIGPAGEKE